MPKSYINPTTVIAQKVNQVTRPGEERTDAEATQFYTDQWIQQFGTDGSGGSGVGAANFNLNKDVQLKNLALQRKELLRQQRTGLRDIQQGRLEALENVNRNALRRGIFRSGIRLRNRNRVNREGDEAASDLQERIGIALEVLANRQRGVEGQQYGGSGGGGSQPTATDLIGLLEKLRILDAAEAPDPNDLDTSTQGIEGFGG